MWQCPKCKSLDLHVEVTITVRLIQDDPCDPDNFQTEDTSGDRMWEDRSEMTCQACGHSAQSWQFHVTEEEPQS